jgi:hypothetical protein
MPPEEASLQDKLIRRLLGVLQVVLWFTALRHGLTLLRLGWENTRILRGFAPGHPRGMFRAGVWLPHRWHTRLFSPVVLFPRPNPKEAERISRLHRRINRVYSGYRPQFDLLRSSPARRLQAAMVAHQFRRVLHLRIRPDEAFQIAGYGSVGIVVRDFLNYASYFGWSVPLSLPFQLFLAEVPVRQTTVGARQSILLTLLAIVDLNRRPGLLEWARAGWYSAERVLLRTYWSLADSHEHKMRLIIARSTQFRESKQATGLLQRMAVSEQRTLLAGLADEMLFNTVDELLDLRAQLPRSVVTHHRFEAALCALEKNVTSRLQFQFKKENENVRQIA